MSTSVLAAILVAAFLHAAWNAALKSRTDTFMAALAVMSGAALIGALALPFLAPPARASWPFIAASGLIHIAYYSLLAASYRHADIGHAYPLMRGVAPVLVAVAGIFLTGETLQAAQWSAIGLICAGGAALTFGARGHASGGMRQTVLVLLTAVTIAAYTLVDGLGVRRSGSPAAYTAWVFITSGIGIAVVSWRRTAGQLPGYMLRNPTLPLLGGVATTVSYSLALWAMTRAPVAVVAALRETSIVFATAIAVFVLRERATRARICGAGLVALGAAAVRLA